MHNSLTVLQNDSLCHNAKMREPLRILVAIYKRLNASQRMGTDHKIVMDELILPAEAH